MSAFGWGNGGADARRKLGLPGGGPKYVLTPLCVMDFDDESKQMRLKSLHPGVDAATVRDNTGFELVIPSQVPTTPAPTAAELSLLRTRVDTAGRLRR